MLGTGITIPQALLQARLGWTAEYVVSTGAPYRPPHYKIDIAEPTLKIAIEVDGASHNSQKVIAADKRKEAWMTEHGWRLLRFTNSRVLRETDAVVEEVMSLVFPSTT